MIGSLRGRVLELDASGILLEVQGVGYVVRLSSGAYSNLHLGDECLLYIHDHIREDSHDLYGFQQRAELYLFERLLSVSGVGPKVALTLLSVGSHDMVRSAILKGDLTLLTSVPGVGKKTAQKIILDLKGQLVEEQELLPGDGEVVGALVSLGYSTQQAREALRAVSKDQTDVSEKIREALRHLAT